MAKETQLQVMSGGVWEVSKAEAARMMGVSPSSVTNWIKKGMPTRYGAGTGRATAIFVPDMINWWKEHEADSVKRLTKGRSIEQEQLRTSIDGQTAIKTLLECAAELEEIDTELKNQERRFVEKNMSVESMDALNMADLLTKNRTATATVRIGAIKQRADINLKLLDRVLPTLKSVEVKDPDGNDPFAALRAAVADSR